MDTTIFTVIGLDHKPVARVQVPPDYPTSLKTQGISGNVRVEFEVDTKGYVVSAHAVSSSNWEFEAAAVRAVLKWRFQPGLRQNVPVRFRMVVPIEFGFDKN